MKPRQLERQIIVGSRFMAGFAVLGALCGSLLMFALGLANVYEAYSVYFPWRNAAATVPPAAAAVISVIESLDRFLIAIVLLYFAYGVYSLFIHPETAEEDLALPAWLRISQIGQLKQVVAEVIIVVLFVLFLRTALNVFQAPEASLTLEQLATFLALPFAAALLAFSLWLVQLHPKTPSEASSAPTEGSKIAPPGARKESTRLPE